MSEFQPPSGETEVIRPSLLHNGFLALGCLILAVALFRLDPADIQGAYYMGAFLLFSALVIMTTHLPGATGIWIDREGFLLRDMYKSERYRWDEVGPFIVRRRLFGKGIEFSYQPLDGGPLETRSLPRGLGGAPWKVAKRMNDWHAWVTGGLM